jgi:hypothetical protein
MREEKGERGRRRETGLERKETGEVLKERFFWGRCFLIWFSNLVFFSLFSVKLLVEQKDEEIDVDFSLVKDLHHGYIFVLQLQQVLNMKIKAIESFSGFFLLVTKLSCLI